MSRPSTILFSLYCTPVFQALFGGLGDGFKIIKGKPSENNLFSPLIVAVIKVHKGDHFIFWILRIYFFQIIDAESLQPLQLFPPIL